MAQTHTVSMVMLHLGTPRDQEAREQLAAALPGIRTSRSTGGRAARRRPVDDITELAAV
jgi:hypothetical protein